LNETCGSHHDGHTPISAFESINEYTQKGITKKVSKLMKGVWGYGDSSAGRNRSVNSMSMQCRYVQGTALLQLPEVQSKLCRWLRSQD
jgi:hypothetical protein